MFAPPRRSDGKRKLIEFRPEIWQALVLLARDSGKSLEALADEAFTDLLRRYSRPLSLKEALRESARRLPANDDLPQDKCERS
jgi:antitoxin-like ribbon-helix-helix protein